MKKSSFLTTSRLLLIPPLSTELNALEGLWQNHQVRQYLGGPIAEEEIKAKLSELTNHWCQYDFGLWAVQTKHKYQIIGLCGLHHSEDGVELSYIFFPEYWGQGFAFEAAEAILEYGFSSLKLNEITAITQVKNLASCHLLEKLGMQAIKNVRRFNATQRIYKLPITLYYKKIA